MTLPSQNEVNLAGVFTDINVEQARRVYDPEDISCTISAGGGTGSIPKLDVSNITHSFETRIRYLTERECLRLMGQTDDAIDRLFEAEPTKTARYRFAGNSIVVNVLEAIFKGIYIDRAFRTPQPTLEAYQ